jgi:hypothetical protein
MAAKIPTALSAASVNRLPVNGIDRIGIGADRITVNRVAAKH